MAQQSEWQVGNNSFQSPAIIWITTCWEDTAWSVILRIGSELPLLSFVGNCLNSLDNVVKLTSENISSLWHLWDKVDTPAVTKLDSAYVALLWPLGSLDVDTIKSFTLITHFILPKYTLNRIQECPLRNSIPATFYFRYIWPCSELTWKAVSQTVAPSLFLCGCHSPEESSSPCLKCSNSVLLAKCFSVLPSTELTYCLRVRWNEG